MRSGGSGRRAALLGRAGLALGAVWLLAVGAGCEEPLAEPSAAPAGVELGHDLRLELRRTEGPAAGVDDVVTYRGILHVGGVAPREIQVSVAAPPGSGAVLVDAHLRFPLAAGGDRVASLDTFSVRRPCAPCRVGDRPFDAETLSFRALDRFGGDLSRTTTATGRFRVEQMDGRWWLVTPAGHAFFSAGVNHTTFTGDYSPPIGRAPYHEAALARYGDQETWAAATADRLRGWSVNTLGAWSHEGSFPDMPYAEVMSLSRAAPEVPGWPGGQTGQRIRDYYHPDFETNLALRAEEARSCAENPFCIGMFSDNELPWGRSVLQIGTYLDAYLTLPPGAPGKLALQAFFEARYGGDIAAFNATWSLGLASFDELQDLTEVEDDSFFCAEDARRADRQAFVAEVASVYFEKVHHALRAISPDMLILGSRFLAVYTAPAIYQAAAPWVDVISINDYDWDQNGRGLFRSEGAPYGYLFLDDPVSDLATVHALTGRPLLISEWTVRTPTPNADVLFPPFLPTAADQTERSDRYEAFMRALLERPFVVGSHWFKFHDQPATGRGDGENSRFGTVDIDDDPYPELTGRMAQVGASIYDPAAGSPTRAGVSSVENGSDAPAPALGRRVFSVSPVEDERTGFFVFILPGVNVSDEVVADGPLLLDAGSPGLSGHATLSLAQDVTLAYVAVTRDVACLRLRAEGSHGLLSCEGGAGHDATVTQLTGDPDTPPVVAGLLGDDSGPGSASLFVDFEFAVLPAGAPASECWATASWQPAYETVLSTATVTTTKGPNVFDFPGEPFVCGVDGEGWRQEDGPGMLVLGAPVFDTRLPPPGDLAAAFRMADVESECR